MAPKSGEVDTAEGATTKPETTEFVDLSTESGSLTPRKRKAEILATANEDEEEEEEKEEAVDSCESDQEWDVDSFKDEDFHSSDVSDDEDWRRYVRQCYKSEKKSLVLNHIVRAVVKMAVGVKSYITFMARETPEGELVEYQGKAEWKVWQRKIHPLLCRPASDQRKKGATLS